jgi:hypothetical protein
VLAEQSKAWISNKLRKVNEMKISCVIWLSVYLGLLRFSFSDSVMAKIAFNDPYRFVAAIIPWHRDLVGKERPA